MGEYVIGFNQAGLPVEKNGVARVLGYYEPGSGFRADRYTRLDEVQDAIEQQYEEDNGPTRYRALEVQHGDRITTDPKTGFGIIVRAHVRNGRPVRPHYRRPGL